VQEKLDSILFGQYKDIATGLQQAKKFSEALEYYEKCLKITRKATTLDNISIYVNKCACLLFLEKFERTVQECNDALRLIKNYKNKFQERQESEKDRLKDIEVRLIVRRGNALAKLNRVTEAIAEYEKAYKLQPSEAIQRDLDKLKR